MLLSIPEVAADLSPPALVLLVALAAHPPRGAEVNIRQQDLTVITKSSRSTVQRALSELQQVGLLEIIHRGATAPILRLPWREFHTPDLPSPMPNVESRLSYLEERLATIEGKLASFTQGRDRKIKASKEALGEYASNDIYHDAASKEDSQDAASNDVASKENLQDAASKEDLQDATSNDAFDDTLKTTATSAVSKRREQHIRDLKPKVGPESKVTDDEILQLTKQHEQGLTRSIVMQAFHVSEQAAKRYIKRALDAGLLRVEGQSRARRYFCAAAEG